MIEHEYTVAVMESGERVAWPTAVSDIGLIARQIPSSVKRVVIDCSCSYKFFVSLLACLSIGKTVVLLPNGLETTRLKYIDEYDCVVDDAYVSLCVGGDRIARLPSPASDVEPWVPDNATLIFYTSGSSGEPKKVVKAFGSLVEEVRDSSRLFGLAACSLTVSTVPHQHLYGLLFKIIASFENRRPFYAEIIRFPSQMSGLDNFLLVSSPAFLSRLDQGDAIVGARTVISSGGPLAVEDGKKVIKIFNAPGFEVYGSTETGGIGHRRLSDQKVFLPFPGVEVSADKEGALRILSRYMNGRQWVTCDDQIRLLEDGRFEVVGRRDDVVKIEEKRISLNEIARAIASSFDEIERVHVVTYDTGRRKRLGALVVARLDKAHFGPAELIDSAIEKLKSSIDPIFIPKKWKVVESMEMNEVGKVSRDRIVSEIFGHDS